MFKQDLDEIITVHFEITISVINSFPSLLVKKTNKLFRFKAIERLFVRQIKNPHISIKALCLA